ncbi:MAG: hypothetical protein KKB50_09430 [Planctomycetes bacterium]|nr:hypothetical protein [Planctomycetota bacterium]
MPVKLFVFAVVTFFVLFPSPGQFVRHLSRLRNLDAIVEPDAPQLAEWEEELQDWATSYRARLEAGLSEEAKTVGDGDVPPVNEMQRRVQGMVLERVRYAWDWDTWGSADYIPTVAEMFAAAAGDPHGELREDCDGRAVLAASLMRRMGYKADLVTDLRHVWVKTPQGEWMGPGKAKAMVSTPEGTRLNWAVALGNVPMSLSYGISVFPLARELVILAAAYVLLLHTRTPWRTALLAAVLLVQGLLFMRCGVFSPQQIAGFGRSWPATIGLLHIVGGICILLVVSHRARLAAPRARA